MAALLFGFDELVTVATGPVAAVLLVWVFGVRAWWWVLLLSIVLAIVAKVISESFLEGFLEDEPEPPPRKRKSPPKKATGSRPRRKSKVVDLAAERARRAGVPDNG